MTALTGRRAGAFILWLATALILSLPAFAQKAEDEGAAARTQELRSPGPEDTLAEEEDGKVRVFGANVFTGRFSQQPFTGFNPDYQIMIGDSIRVQFWGAVDLSEVKPVDAQGNIFIQGIGPIRVQGVRNDKLTSVIEGRVKEVYREQVGIYANLESSQPVSVIVSGFVRRPGMYRGLSSDSALYFLDLAGGIDLERGSFLDVRVLRNSKLRQKINLYDFLLHGELPALQFADGDTVHVGAITNSVTVEGAAHNVGRFEFAEEQVPAARILEWVGPKAEATHLRVKRSDSGDTTAEYLPLIAIQSLTLRPGDSVLLVPEIRRQTIVVEVAGEHDSAREFALPRGSKIGDILPLLVANPRSNIDAIQLFRASVKERQKVLLDQSLDQLEHEVLTARSTTDEEAALRLKESELIQKFVDRARKLTPQGLVVLGNPEQVRDLYLEDGDVLFVPKRSNVIALAGQVMFPTSVAFIPGASAEDYIEKAGGFTRNADKNRILIRRVNGEIDTLNGKASSAAELRPGDEIMVLPEPDLKALQVGKTLAEVLFRLAVSTAVILAL